MNRFILCGVVVALAVTGCTDTTEQPTLLSTKSPSQLLRNEIASRVPSSAVDGEITTTDSSESCGDDGITRSWRSDANLPIAADQAPRLRVITETLVKSLVDQGWTASTRDASSTLVEFRLTSTTSSSDVRITADASEARTIHVVVNGPCVETDGENSDEVVSLESESQ